MFDLLFVTNRGLCREDFLTRVEKLAAARPSAILLREKDLSPEDYLALAEQVLKRCARHGTLCILHGFPQAARALGVRALHLPLPVLRTLSPEERGEFPVLGASCHSVAEAVEAQELGCTYLTAGHVFDTGCKAGVPGRGLDFLTRVCGAVDIPVYAIGGIGPENIPLVRGTGAAGACVMSEAMTCDNPGEYLKMLREKRL